MSQLSADVSYACLLKHGEELCGDKVYVVQAEDSTIIVLADGLGSGVKANILATLTSTIAGNMLKQGASISDVVQTIAETLPVCKVRGIAYSTFTILQVFHNGIVHLAEYDNPPAFHFRRDTLATIPMNECVINGKLIKESYFNVDPHDTFLLVSDGVIHAGVGGVLNLGWQWEHVSEYLERIIGPKSTSEEIAESLSSTCNHLYYMEPGDDATVVCVKFRYSSPVAILVGPPRIAEEDGEYVRLWIQGEGKKVICGGATANIVARELNRSIRIEIPTTMNPEVPPTSCMDGVDLITEGVLTLRKLSQYLRQFIVDGEMRRIAGDDGAARLLRLLMDEACEIHFFVGTAINPAHQNPDFPPDMSIKLRIIQEINEMLNRLGKRSDVKLF